MCGSPGACSAVTGGRWKPAALGGRRSGSIPHAPCDSARNSCSQRFTWEIGIGMTHVSTAEVPCLAGRSLSAPAGHPHHPSRGSQVSDPSLFVPRWLDGFHQTLLLEGHTRANPAPGLWDSTLCSAWAGLRARCWCFTWVPTSCCSHVQCCGPRQTVEPPPSWPWHGMVPAPVHPSPVCRLAEGGTGVNLEVLFPDAWSPSWPHSSQIPGSLVSSKAPCFSSSVTSVFLAAPCPGSGHPIPLPPSLSA